MAKLARSLEFAMERPVVDETGLAGTFDIDLQWTPGVDAPGAGNAPVESGPSVFTALQEQLGLKLESARGPVEVLVIDSVERPTSN